MMRQIFTTTLFLGVATFYAGSVLGEERSGCCTSKTVGTDAYTLRETETAPDTLGCQSSCVYERDEEPGSRYCFKKGDLPVTCTEENLFDPGACTGVYNSNTKSCDVSTDNCNAGFNPVVEETVAEQCTCLCE